MSNPAPIQYYPQDRLKLLQNQDTVGTGTPRQINFSSNFRIIENDLDNYYTIDVTGLAGSYVSSVSNAGLTGIPIIDSLSANNALLRSIAAASNRINVTLDESNKAVSVDVNTAQIQINDLGNVTISGALNNDFLVYNAVLGKWRNFTLLPVAWANIDKAGSLISDLSDVVTGSLAEGDVMVYSAGVGQWRNLAKIPWTSVDASASKLDDLGDVVITSGSLANNQVLAYNSTSSQWVNTKIPVSALSDTVFTSIANNDVLTWDAASTKWINKAIPGFAVVHLDDVGDVTITTPLNGDVLTYETATSQWKNKTPGALTVAHIDDIGDVTITTPVNGNVLTYDSALTQWKNAAPGALTVAHLDDIGDVTIVSPVNNQMLLYETASSLWKNQTVTFSVAKIDDIGDATVATPVDLQVLMYEASSSQWKNKAQNIGQHGDTSFTALANNDFLIYQTSAAKWQNKQVTFSVAKLDDIGDVTITTPADNQAVLYEAATAQFKNKTLSFAVAKLDDIGDTTITTPVDNQVLTYEAASAQWKNKAPTGSASTTVYTEFGQFLGGMMPLAGSTFYGNGLGQLFLNLNMTTATGDSSVYGVGQDQAGGSWTRFSTTTTNHSVGVIKTPVAVTQRKYNPVFVVRLAPVDVTSRRYYCGLCSVGSLPTNTDTVLANTTAGVIVGFRAGTDTNWKIFCNDAAGAMSVTDSGVAVSATTPVTITIVLNDTVPKIQWGVDDSALNDITTKVPPQTTGLFAFVGHVETTTTSDRAMIVYYSNLYHTRY